MSIASSAFLHKMNCCRIGSRPAAQVDRNLAVLGSLEALAHLNCTPDREAEPHKLAGQDSQTEAGPVCRGPGWAVEDMTGRAAVQGRHIGRTAGFATMVGSCCHQGLGTEALEGTGWASQKAAHTGLVVLQPEVVGIGFGRTVGVAGTVAVDQAAAADIGIAVLVLEVHHILADPVLEVHHSLVAPGLVGPHIQVLDHDLALFAAFYTAAESRSLACETADQSTQAAGCHTPEIAVGIAVDAMMD